MTSLEQLDITFSVDPMISDASLSTNFNFRPFFGVFKHKLNSLSTSGLLLPHLFDLYKNVPTFTTLRKLEIFVIANVRDFLPLDQISRCIVKHADTLEHLVLKPQARHPRGILNNYLFLHWLTLRGTHNHQIFSSLVLPRLRIIELGLHDSWVNWNIQNHPAVFPDFARVTPALRDLTITDAELSFSRLCELVDCLPTSNGRCTLELLKLHADVLSPELMNLFAGRMPDLKLLELHLSVATENMAHSSPNQVCLSHRKLNQVVANLHHFFSSPFVKSYALGAIQRGN